MEISSDNPVVEKSEDVDLNVTYTDRNLGINYLPSYYQDDNFSQNDFLKNQKFFDGNENYYFDKSLDKNQDLEKIDEILYTETWKNFKYLLVEKKIKLQKKEISSKGWFWNTESSSLYDDILFTFEKYKEKILEEKQIEVHKKYRERKTRRERMEEEEEVKINVNPDEEFKKFKQKPKYRKFLNNLKIFFPDYFDDSNFYNYKSYFFTETSSLGDSYNSMIEFAREKYNEKKDNYNFRVENPSFYREEKDIQKTKKLGKELDEILAFLKPHVLDYEARKKGDFRNYYTDVLEEGKKKAEEAARQELEKKRKAEEAAKQELEKKRKAEEAAKQELEKKRKAANEEIENLEYKIRDAQSKYSMKKAKYNKIFLRLRDLEILEKKRNILQEKLKEKNLQIEERQKILKEKTELNEKLKNIDNLRNQVADLKSKIPDVSVYEQEKTLRENEIEKLKKLNETSLREKNALFRSLEFEKMKEEIRIREEERYQQEQREKEELKQLKIVFLKEKKIGEKRLNELKIITRNLKEQNQNMNENQQDFLSQKKFLENIQQMKESKLKEKKLEIEKRKIATLQLEKEKLLKQKTYKAERQKLFQDSIQRDIDDLNLQKELLQKSTDFNKKILANTKKEISARQSEIEKNIRLNLENVKLRENKILAEERKIKLDVFQTLSDVKEQTAIKLDVENTLENLKEEIIRKQDVSDLLSDTITRIADTEISEVENYNSFLQSEIDFKKKFVNESLSLTERREILAEEKEDLIERLENVKSQKLKKIYNTRENAIEQQMKILLVEGADNLKLNLFSLKYEIQSLEAQKEISERKEDLAKFQSDNYKKELKLRKHEIELLKNIRLKVLETERKTRRQEAQNAISDIVKSIEKTERDVDVREKLDEILDDVETKEISKSTKSSLFSILDKIENKEIHDAAKEKLDFILGKIELHDNIDESKKALDKILDKIENAQIRKDVEEKLDEILDDVEYDDYDFLNEDDDLDTFISSVKKHLSGEKRMEQFSKIDKILDETRKEDSKLKMEENIEMEERGQRPAPEDGVGETSFDEFNDYNFFIDRIEDPEIREKTRLNLGNFDSFEKESEKIPKIKNAYKAAINNALWEDQLDLDYWDGSIILDGRAKFLYEQKVNNVNTALGNDYNIHIDPNDLKVREFLDINLIETFSEKRGEINGYSYNGEKIISRNISRNFYFNYLKKPFVCQKFINELKETINRTAKSKIASESYFEGRAVKDCALEYIGELREEQSYQIDSSRNAKEMRDALREVNEIDKEIKDIKKNSSFKMRLKIFRRTLSWRFTKLLRFLWKHKGKTFSIVGGLLIAGVGVLLNQLGVIAVVHQLKRASASVKQYANDVHEMGKRIIQNVQALYRIPGTIIGYVLIGLSVFLRILYFATRLSGTYSSAAIFGALGVTFEALIYFEGSAEKMNEKVADAMEETGNILENAGIRTQKYIIKNSPKWYWDKPTQEKSILEIVESGASKMVYKIAQGTQKAGKKVEEAGEVVRSSLLYLKIFVLCTITILAIMFVRNYLL